MPSEIRLKGRSLIMGALTLFTLTLAVSVSLGYSMSLMPLIYRSALLPLVKNFTDGYVSYINLFAALSVLFLSYMSLKALKTGSDRYMLKKAQNVCASTKDIFYYFIPRQFFSLFYVSCRVLFLRLLLFIFVNIPTTLCMLLLLNLGRSTFSAAVSFVLAAGCGAFFISGIYFYNKLSASLFLIPYYFIKGEFLSFRHLLSSSQNAMRGKTKSLLRLKMSFTGWFLSCVLILPCAYVWSYYNQTMAAYAEEIMWLQ